MGGTKKHKVIDRSSDSYKHQVSMHTTCKMMWALLQEIGFLRGREIPRIHVGAMGLFLPHFLSSAISKKVHVGPIMEPK